MPKGIPNAAPGAPSEQTRRLVEALRDLEDRLAEERRKDRARATLLAFVQKHGLAASDLREVAKVVAAREVGGAPVVSNNAARVALGRKMRAAREAKGMTGADLQRLLKLKGSGVVSSWEAGRGMPSGAKKRAAVIKALDLPKDFFPEKSKPNGVAT